MMTAEEIKKTKTQIDIEWDAAMGIFQKTILELHKRKRKMFRQCNHVTEKKGNDRASIEECKICGQVWFKIRKQRGKARGK